MIRLKNFGRFLLYIVAIPLVFLVVLPLEYMKNLLLQIPVAFRRANRMSDLNQLSGALYDAGYAIKRSAVCIWTGEEYSPPKPEKKSRQERVRGLSPEQVYDPEE